MIFFEITGIFVYVLILETIFVLFFTMIISNGSPFEAELEDFFVPLLVLIIVLTFYAHF